MLNTLNIFSSITVYNIFLKILHLYQFDNKTNTQILEDLSNTIDIKLVLESLTISSVLFKFILIFIDFALRVWFWSFHLWILASAQAVLRDIMGNNKPLRKIKYAISYKIFVDIVQKFSEIWKAHSKTLQKVQNMIVVEYSKDTQQNVKNSRGLIHGDFWTRK